MTDAANLPLIPDKVVDKIRKGKDVALEELAGDKGAELLDARRSARSTPLHAENLQAITREDAARRRTITPGGLPSMPATRRVIPAPFKRPGIVIDHHGKTWQQVRAGAVVPGDIVPGVGVVAGSDVGMIYQTKGELLGTFSSVATRETWHSGGVVLADPDALVATGNSVILHGESGTCSEPMNVDDLVQVFRLAPAGE